MKYRTLLLANLAVFVVSSLVISEMAFSQAAGAGADYNKRDRNKVRLMEYDKPLRDDPIGNAITGGVASGVIRGSVGAAAAAIGIRSVKGTAAEVVKERNKDK